VINTSGCGTTVKDYGHMFRNEALAEDAARVGLAMDVSSADEARGARGRRKGLRVAYHAACSLQHGQQIKTYPKDAAETAGFEVVEPRTAICAAARRGPTT
jgi:glycolate oxidase iron-sulfur subunit